MIKKIIISSIILSFVFFPFIINAKVTGGGGSTNLNNPLGETKDIPVLIGTITKAILGIVGSLALLMFVYGGVLWMTSAGNDQRVQTGKNTLMWAAIGLAVIFASYAIIQLIFSGLGVG